MKIRSLLVASMSIVIMGNAVANSSDDEQRQKYNQGYQLEYAVRTKNYDEAKRMLDLGYKNSYDQLFRSLLISACNNGDDVMLDLLLGYATEADKEALNNDVWSFSPMSAAAQAKSYKCIQKLLDFGITTEIKGEIMPPLAQAIANNDSKCARLLLQHGASVKEKSQYDIYWEHKGDLVIDAAYRGSLEVLKLLLEYGADANSQNSNGESAIDFAMAMGHKNCVALLREKGAQDPKRLTPYSLANCRRSSFYKGRTPSVLDYILDLFR